MCLLLSKQLQKVFTRANAKKTFTSAGKSLRTLVANTLDYRDENHVLMRLADQRTSTVIQVFNEPANPNKHVRNQIKTMTDGMIKK